MRPDRFQPTERVLERFSPYGKPLRACLVFPGNYRIATGNLGFHQVYRLINSHPAWSCERCCAELLKSPLGPRSLETDTPLAEFDLLAFSLPYELAFPEVLVTLRTAGLEILSKDRDPNDPIVLVGGIAVTGNPDPLMDCVDVVLPGESEHALPVLLDALADNSRRNGQDRLPDGVPGVWCPFLSNHPPAESPPRLNLDTRPAHSAWISPAGEFGGAFLVEVSRGCKTGCRFCLISRTQKPVRALSRQALLELSDRVKEEWLGVADEFGLGQPRIGIVGAAFGSHPEMTEILIDLQNRGWSVTASSLEIDSATPEFLSLLSQNQQTLTLAPERGDEEERFRLGKRISDDEILATVAAAAEAGISRLKVYFICGLVEPAFYSRGAVDDSDLLRREVDSIQGCVAQIRRAFVSTGSSGRVAVTCSPFVPKKGTPWQDWPMATEKHLKQLDRMFARSLGRLKSVEYRGFSAREALLQGLFSQGRRELGLDMADALGQDLKMKDVLRDLLNRNVATLTGRE